MQEPSKPKSPTYLTQYMLFNFIEEQMGQPPIDALHLTTIIHDTFNLTYEEAKEWVEYYLYLVKKVELTRLLRNGTTKTT